MKHDTVPGSSTSTSSATYTASAPASARSRSSSIPCSATYACSGGSRSRAPTSATSAGATDPSSSARRSGIPHAFPEGEVSGVLRSPCASSQTTARRPCRAARPRIAPRCAQQQPPRTSGRCGSPAAITAACASTPSSATTSASGYRTGIAAARAMVSPPAPQARGTRTRPAANAAPQLWHSYPSSNATAVSVRQSGHRARRVLTSRAPRCPAARRPSSRRARTGVRRPSCSRRRPRGPRA